MGNSHGVPDTMYELQATASDLLPACIVSTTFPAVPAPPGLTLAAFATAGYVKDGPTLVYVTQEAHTVTLVGGDGTYWVALTQDSFTTYATWNRVAGTQYAWKPSATRPPDVDGLLVFLSCTVSGGVVTAVTPAPGVTRAEALRALSGLGTMATQNADAVAVTGGSISVPRLGINTPAPGSDGRSYFNGPVGIGVAPDPALSLNVAFGSQLQGNVGIGRAPSSHAMDLRYVPAAGAGLTVQPTSDSGTTALFLLNAAGTGVGSITTTASATSYNTSSDVRLKRKIHSLLGGLEALQRLRPVSFVWNSTDESDRGFLAHELQVVCPQAVTGQPDDVNPDGSVKPQQVDQSKLIPILVAAVQELLARVEVLEQALA
jgi:hypothetical protein